MAQAVIGSTALTYADWAKRMDDGYKVASIIELLSQTNEILDDMMVVEASSNMAPTQLGRPQRQVHHRPSHRHLWQPRNLLRDRQRHRGSQR